MTSRSIRSPLRRIRRPDGPSDRLQRAVALLAQHLEDDAAHHRLVLDHQHGFAGGGMFGSPCRRRMLGIDVAMRDAADRA